LGLTLVVLLCLFMVLPLSQPLWNAIGLLSFVQFPWRFLGPASIFLAMLAGLGAMQLWSWLTSQFAIRNSLFIILLTLCFVLFALPWLFPSRAKSLPNDISPADTILFEVETGWLGTTAAADYLPRTVESLPVPDSARAGLIATQLPDELMVQDLQVDFNSIRFNYELAGSEQVVFHQFLFPGWQATLDGIHLELTSSDPEGLITAVLPPGEHSFELSFGSTTLRTIANLISVISLMGLVFLVVYCVLRRPPSGDCSQFAIQNSKFIIYSIATVLIIFGAKTVILDHVNSPFKTVRFDEQTLATIQGVNFGNVIKLLEADWQQAPIPVDGKIDITLAWQALPPIPEEYSVSVQLIGENGRRGAQSDSFHPAGLPLPRWQAGEYGFDKHRLTPSPAMPPGEYELVVFVYNLATGQRLDMLNEAGQPIGNEFSLGYIALSSPTQFPEPSDLAINQRETEGGGVSPFLAENVQLLGYDAPLDTVEVGQVVPLTLYWYTPETPLFDYETDIWVGCENEVIATSMNAVQAGSQASTPNADWQPGQLQRAEFDVLLRPVDEAGNPLMPGFCTLYLGLSANEERTSVALETFTISAPERIYVLPEPAAPINVASFGDAIFLVGSAFEQTNFAPGETIPLTLYWRPEVLIDIDYKVFVQLLDENGRLVAQQDQIPANGARPTTGWVPGEFVQDDYTLVLPSDVAPGNYQLITGFYDAETGKRLQLADGSGDAITIPISIEVKTAE